jgi:transcriptional regulator with XRE-family HTH domain
MALYEPEAPDDSVNDDSVNDDSVNDDSVNDDSDMANDIGRKISARRKAQKLTLVRLASLTGLSQPFLSQVERGRAHPSMSSLHRIARALGTETPELMSSPIDAVAAVAHAEVDTDAVSLVRAHQGSVNSHKGNQVKALVAGTRAMYPLEFLVAGKQFEDYFQHEQPEFIYVMAGSIEVELDGEMLESGHMLHTLAQGDTLYFTGGVRHRWRALGVWPARVLMTQANWLGPDAQNIHNSNN